jgi:acyl-coenzyme A thioesterase PaaI-like protein
MNIDEKHEGWPGIPHGGVGMTAFIELADMLDEGKTGFPLKYSFRFGGEQISVGDTVQLKVKKYDGKYRGEMATGHSGMPYLKASMGKGMVDSWDTIAQAENRLREGLHYAGHTLKIPDMSIRLLFTPQVQHENSMRVFSFNEYSKGYTLLYCRPHPAGEFSGNVFNTLRKTQVHPGVLVTLLDETMGWAGFLSAWQGGVTVTLDINLFKPVKKNDRFMVSGMCTKISGSSQRKLVYVTGAVFVENDGSIELAGYAKGKWLTLPGYREKMVKYLLGTDSASNFDTRL